MILGIYGAGHLGVEFTRVAIDINKEAKRWESIVFIDDTPEKIGTVVEGIRVFGFEQAIEEWGVDGIEFVIGNGEPNVKDIIFQKLINANCEVTNLIHPTSYCSESARLGKGVVIKLWNLVNPQAHYGNNVLIQNHTALGAGVILGDNVVISPHCFVGGDTKIGKNTYVAPHSCVRNGLTIGENVIIGMGSVVTKDIPDNAVVYGNPAKIVRVNESKRVFK